MLQLRSSPWPETDALALEANAAQARCAFVCVYSSSDEYEADLIMSRRAAGAYRPRRPLRQVVTACALAALLLAALILLSS